MDDLKLNCTSHYDPVTGRFVSKDPILFNAPGTNNYSYSMNDPINFSDPTGKDFSGFVGCMKGVVTNLAPSEDILFIGCTLSPSPVGCYLAVAATQSPALIAAAALCIDPKNQPKTNSSNCGSRQCCSGGGNSGVYGGFGGSHGDGPGDGAAG